jgi:hypothetical protein
VPGHVDCGADPDPRVGHALGTEAATPAARLSPTQGVMARPLPSPDRRPSARRPGLGAITDKTTGRRRCWLGDAVPAVPFMSRSVSGFAASCGADGWMMGLPCRWAPRCRHGDHPTAVFCEWGRIFRQTKQSPAPFRPRASSTARLAGSSVVPLDSSGSSKPRWRICFCAGTVRERPSALVLSDRPDNEQSTHQLAPHICENLGLKRHIDIIRLYRAGRFSAGVGTAHFRYLDSPGQCRLSLCSGRAPTRAASSHWTSLTDCSP